MWTGLLIGLAIWLILVCWSVSLIGWKMICPSKTAVSFITLGISGALIGTIIEWMTR